MANKIKTLKNHNMFFAMYQKCRQTIIRAALKKYLWGDVPSKKGNK